MNTERIDVLAVMDDAAQVMGRDGNRIMAEARAAVAELVEAAREYQAAMEDYVSAPRRVVSARNLRAALARIGAA